MERFKAVEKDMKTKAFSKVGLGAAAKLDPKEQEKEEEIQFLAEMVGELDRQIETTEAEVETLQVTAKKGKRDTTKNDRLAELEHFAERHKWHQSKLEALRRALENDGVDIEQIKDLNDSIKYYVENNQEADFMEDEGMYDDFHLQDDDDAFATADADRLSTQDTQSVHEDADVEDKSKTTASLLAKSKSADLPAQARRPSASLHGVKSPLPALATLHTTTSNPSTNIAPGMKPAPIPTIPIGQTLKYASAAAAAAASDKLGVGLAPLPPPPATAQQAPAPTLTANATNPSPALAAVQPAAPPTTQSPQPRTIRRTKAADSAQASPATLPAQPVSRPSSTIPGPASQLTSGLQPPPGLGGNVSRAQTPQVNGSMPQTKSPQVTDESVFHLPSSLADILESFQATNERAGTSPVIDERMLAVAHAACPTPLDAEKPNHYRPQTPYTYTPAHYPQEPLTVFDDPRLYSKMEVDSLFYSFYYRQGSYQQYLAAKALKSQSWRFHKQYQTWFQRHEEPKNITDEFEQGTYRFFDYESTWYVYIWY